MRCLPKASLLPVAALVGLTAAPPLPAADVERLPDGFLLAVGGGLLRVEACADDVLRVAYAKDRDVLRPQEPRDCAHVAAPAPVWT